MSTKLERSAKKSMRKMAELNYNANIEFMTNYYIVVDQWKKCELSPITKAKIAVQNKMAAGQLDELNQPLKLVYEQDPQVVYLQSEIEKLVKEQTAA